MSDASAKVAAITDHALTAEQADNLDYIFQMPQNVSIATFKNQAQRFTKQFRNELRQIQLSCSQRRMSALRVDLCEVMCGSQSELTRQVMNMGGKAIRFSEVDGDLSTAAGRRELFKTLVVHRP